MLIDYDELAQEIRFYEVSSDGKQSLAIKVPLSLYQEKGSDEAERVMGETVFTFFDRWAAIKMGLRDYVGEARQSIVSRRSEIAKLAESGNAEAQYQFAIDCFTTGARDHSLNRLS